MRIQNFSESQLISSQSYHGSSVDCLYEDSQHNLWLGTVGSGLIRLKDGALTTYDVKDGLPSPNVTALFEDRDHNLWIGTRAGLCLFKDGRFTTYTKAEGLSGDYVRDDLSGPRGKSLGRNRQPGNRSPQSPRREFLFVERKDCWERSSTQSFRTTWAQFGLEAAMEGLLAI
jgi:hypothetical protein